MKIVVKVKTIGVPLHRVRWAAAAGEPGAEGRPDPGPGPAGGRRGGQRPPGALRSGAGSAEAAAGATCGRRRSAPARPAPPAAPLRAGARGREGGGAPEPRGGGGRDGTGPATCLTAPGDAAAAGTW